MTALRAICETPPGRYSRRSSKPSGIDTALSRVDWAGTVSKQQTPITFFDDANSSSSSSCSMEDNDAISPPKQSSVMTFGSISPVITPAKGPDFLSLRTLLKQNREELELEKEIEKRSTPLALQPQREGKEESIDMMFEAMVKESVPQPPDLVLMAREAALRAPTSDYQQETQKKISKHRPPPTPELQEDDDEVIIAREAALRASTSDYQQETQKKISKHRPPPTPELQEDDDEVIMAREAALRASTLTRKKNRRKTLKFQVPDNDDGNVDEEVRMAEEAALQASKMNQKRSKPSSALNLFSRFHRSSSEETTSEPFVVSTKKKSKKSKRKSDSSKASKRHSAPIRTSDISGTTQKKSKKRPLSKRWWNISQQASSTNEESQNYEPQLLSEPQHKEELTSKKKSREKRTRPSKTKHQQPKVDANNDYVYTSSDTKKSSKRAARSIRTSFRNMASFLSKSNNSIKEDTDTTPSIIDQALAAATMPIEGDEENKYSNAEAIDMSSDSNDQIVADWSWKGDHEDDLVQSHMFHEDRYENPLSPIPEHRSRISTLRQKKRQLELRKAIPIVPKITSAEEKVKAMIKADQERKQKEAEEMKREEEEKRARRKAKKERRRIEKERKASEELMEIEAIAAERKAQREATEELVEIEAIAAERKAKREAAEDLMKIEAIAAERKAEQERKQLEQAEVQKRKAEEERKQMEAERIAEAKRKADREREEAEQVEMRNREKERKQMEAERIAEAKRNAEREQRKAEYAEMLKREKERKQMEAERIAEAKRKADREGEEAEHAEMLRKGKETRQEKIATAKRRASKVLSSFEEPSRVTNNHGSRKEAEAKARAKAKIEARNKAQEERKQRQLEVKKQRERNSIKLAREEQLKAQQKIEEDEKKQEKDPVEDTDSRKNSMEFQRKAYRKLYKQQFSDPEAIRNPIAKKDPERKIERRNSGKLERRNSKSERLESLKTLEKRALRRNSIDYQKEVYRKNPAKDRFRKGVLAIIAMDRIASGNSERTASETVEASESSISSCSLYYSPIPKPAQKVKICKTQQHTRFHPVATVITGLSLDDMSPTEQAGYWSNGKEDEEHLTPKVLKILTEQWLNRRRREFENAQREYGRSISSLPSYLDSYTEIPPYVGHAYTITIQGDTEAGLLTQ